MFGYLCEKCGRGRVKATTIEGFPTRFDGTPFIVPTAAVGVCGKCGAKYFSSGERKKWREQFWKWQESQGRILSAEAIRQLRRDLQLTIADFARLVGCSRQSLYSWENSSRSIPQSRMADLLLRVVRESHARGEVNVVQFLERETRSALPIVKPASHPPRSVGRMRETRDRTRYDLAAVDPAAYEKLYPKSAQPPGFSPLLRAVA
jgi:DNA-binding transcriptional regulator YiaG